LDSEILSATEEGGEVKARTLIKRIVAVGGQTIDIHDGKVFIDGQELDEPYALGNTYVLQDQLGTPYQMYPYTIPEGYVWVMGDNRENSADSRKFGPVSEDTITGRALFRFWPVTRLAFF
ncbi:MAG: signal peptidase I, partial [Eggerthellaceae bacterium]|nr:signal peptidase I [Eggerthellaceae bacterium]